MIILDSTSRSLEIDLDGAVATNQLSFQANYVDVTTTTYTPAQNSGATNSTTAVTLVAAPAASTQRQIKLLTIYNADTAAAVVTVQYNNNATLRTLVKITLAVNATLVYTDGEGWRVFDTSGTIKSGAGTHTLLDASSHTDTAADAVSRGSLIYGNATPLWDELVIGAANRVLGSDGTDAAWVQADHGAALTGLSDDDHTQYLLASGARALTANWDAGSFEIRAETLESDVLTGTAPLTIASTTKVTNLNSDLLDDQSGAYYLDSANFTGTNWTDLTDAGATTLHKHDHGGLDGLADDDHTQYALLAGRSGGQVLTGGTASGDDITLRSTTNATKGDIFLADQGGNVVIGGGTAASELRILEASGSGTNYTAFKAQAQAADITYTLPADDGDADQVLSTNGSGTLDWVAAGSGAMSLLYANSGTNTSSSAANMDTVAISGLTAKDNLHIYIILASVTQQTTTPLLHNSTDGVDITRFSDAVSESIAAGETRAMFCTIGQRQSGNTAIFGHSISATGGESTGSSRGLTATFTTAWTGSWTLALRHGGVTVGGTLQFTWQVFKVAGQ